MKKYKWEQEQIANMKEYIARFGHGSAKLARQAQVRGACRRWLHAHAGGRAEAGRGTALPQLLCEGCCLWLPWARGTCAGRRQMVRWLRQHPLRASVVLKLPCAATETAPICSMHVNIGARPTRCPRTLAAALSTHTLPPKASTAEESCASLPLSPFHPHPPSLPRCLPRSPPACSPRRRCWPRWCGRG